MTPDLTQRDLAVVLDGIAADSLADAKIVEPPVDCYIVAGAMGLSVSTDDRQTGRARFVRMGGSRRSIEQGSIIVRRDPRPERMQWAVAHEIGEACAEHVYCQLDLDPAEPGRLSREKIANELANRLLLPHKWIERDAIACDWDLRDLKAVYSTASHELIARRMLEFSPPIIITIFDNGRRTTRLSNVDGRLPPVTPEERIVWQRCHDSSEPCQGDVTFGRIQAWPVHEPNWKREILRTALADFECTCD